MLRKYRGRYFKFTYIVYYSLDIPKYKYMFPVSSENLSLDKKTDNNISLWLRNLCKLDFFKRSDVHTFITFQKYKPYAWCNDMINTILFVIILEYKISHLDQVLVIRTRNKVLLSNKWHYFKFWNISSKMNLLFLKCDISLGPYVTC